jgi:hypothetical protein
MGSLSLKKQNLSTLIPFQIGVGVYPNNRYTFKSATTNLLGTVFNPSLFNSPYQDILNIYPPNEGQRTFYFDGSMWLADDFSTPANNYIIPNNSIIEITTNDITSVPVGGGAIIQKYYQGKTTIKKQNLGGGTLLLNYIFDPKEIQGLSLWLKADAGVTLSGSDVTAWADQSGNGRNATAIESPTYATNSINGKPALVFANDSYLTTVNIFNGANPRTMIAVYYIDSEQYSNTVIGQSNEDNTNTGTYFLLQSRVDLDSSPYLAGYGDDLSGSPFLNQQLILGTTDYDGTTARLFNNGTQVNSALKTYDTYNGEFYIGAFNEAGNIMEKFGGKIAEIVVYNRVLTTSERQKVETYLREKYAITCGYQNINKLVQTAGNNAPIGATFDNIAFNYSSFASSCSSLGFDPATILNSLGGVDFSSNYVVIRAKTSSTINSDSISDLGGGVINITNTGPSGGSVNKYYRFFVMCKDGWNTVRFNGVNYPI